MTDYQLLRNAFLEVGVVFKESKKEQFRLAIIQKGKQVREIMVSKVLILENGTQFYFDSQEKYLENS